MKNHLLVLVYRGNSILQKANCETIKQRLPEFGSTIGIRDAGTDVPLFKDILKMCCEGAEKEIGGDTDMKILVISKYAEFGASFSQIMRADDINMYMKTHFPKVSIFWAIARDQDSEGLLPGSTINFDLGSVPSTNIDKFLAVKIKNLFNEKIFPQK